MRSTFSNPEFGLGTTAELRPDKEDTENRSWGEFAKDVAIDALGRPIVGALRTGAQAWRTADDQSPVARSVERGLGAAEHQLEDWRSPRARALDTQSIDPRGDERSFWDEPGAGTLHAFLPSVPYALAALGTAGGSLVARGATAAGMGALGAGEALNDLRDYAEQTPLADLQKSPVFQKFYRDFNGDEQAARDALFKEMLDPKSQAVNFLVNALEVPAFRMGMRPSGSVMRIVDRAKAAGQGAVVGGVQGSLEGGTEAYIAELGKVRAGQQESIDTDNITSGALSGAVFAGPTAAFHAVAPRYKATPMGTDVGSVANQQINPPPQQPPPTPNVPVGAPPSAPGTPGADIEPGAPPPAPPGVVPGARSGRYGPGLPIERAGPRLPKEQYDQHVAARVARGPEQEQYGPPTEPLGPDLQPPVIPPGPMIWSGESHTAPVRVMERPPVFQNGQWIQPVAYTNPKTGQTHVLLAPVDQLQEVQGPPAPPRAQGPSVVTPEAPLPPQFPVIETPGMPSPTDFPVEQPPPDLGTVPQEDLQGTLADNPVLRDLRQRFAQQRGEARGVEESTARARQRRINRERADRMPETDWRDVRPPEGRPPPRAVVRVGQTPLRPSPALLAARLAGEQVRRAKRPYETVADRLRERARKERQERVWQGVGEERRAQFTKERTAEERAAERQRQRRRLAVEGELERQAETAAERERRGEQLERTHPLLGGELRDPRLRKLREDVQAFNVRAREARRDRTMSAEARQDMRVDQQVLRRRLAATPDADALGLEVEEIEEYTVKPPTQEQRSVQEFRSTVEQLARMAARGELVRDGQPNTAAQRLVRKLENINYQRSGNRRIDGVEVRARKGALPIPGELYDRLVAAGLVKTPQQQEAEAERSRTETEALRKSIEDRVNAEIARRGKRGLKGKDLRSLAQRLAIRPGKQTSATSARDRAAWASKTPLERRRLRAEARVQERRQIEEIIREMVAQREAEARARVEKGKPPLQQRTTIAGTSKQPFFGTAEMQKLPTAEEAIQQFREGMRQERERERGGEAVKGTRDRFVADREKIARDTIIDAIKKRFPGKNSQQRFLALLERMTKVPPRPPARPRNVNFNLDTPAVRQAVAAHEARVKAWMEAREKQVNEGGDAIRLKEFLEYAIRRTRNEIDAYKKRNNIVREDARNLAQPIWDEKNARYTFRSGVNEASRDYYNFANDLQKMDENLRAMQVALGQRPAPGQTTAPVPLKRSVLRSAGQRRLRPGEQHSVAQPEMQTYINELQRATQGALGEQLQDFAMDMQLMLQGNMEPIRLRREARVEETSRARGVSREFTGLTEDVARSAEEVAAEQAFTEAEIERMGEIAGGSRAAASGRNVVEERALRRIEQRQMLEDQRAREEAEKAGREYDPQAIARQRARQMAAEFPIRWTKAEDVRKLRKGMAFNVDEKGLPADRLGPHKEFTPYTAEERHILDATNELNSMGEPNHPLISPPETVQRALDRVKDMIAKGQVGDLPTEYINDQFFDQLARINSGTTLYYAPYDAVSGLENESPAHYSTTTDRIVVASDISPELYVQSLIHELVHAATERSLLVDPEFRGTTTDLMQRAIAYAKRQGVDLDRLPRDLYGLSNPSEFITEMSTNANFRKFLFRVAAPHNTVIQGAKNVLNAMYHAIRQAMRRVFGNAKDGDTALDTLFYDQSTVLGQADAMMKRKLKQLVREGRPAREAALKVLEEGDGDGRQYMTLSEGGRAFRDGLKETFDRTAFQLNKVRTTDRAPGMGWRTMSDLTHIGSPEFKGLTANLHELFERMQGTGTKLRDEDKREIAELARIWSSWSREGRERAGQFMIDEGMHTAFADAPLGEYGEEYVDQETGERTRDLTGKNAHIDPTLLKNAQVVHEHETMMRRLQETEAALPPMAAVGKRRGHGGFKEFRDRVYAFTSKREDEIRRNNIRDMWAVTDFLPPDLSAKERDRMLDALQVWSDPSAKLTPAQQALLRNAGFFTNRKAVEQKQKIEETHELAKIEGPYSPFTRYGDWALTGRFRIPRPSNAIVLNEDINEKTGELIDDARFVFETREEAEQMVRDVTDQYGIAQLTGGKMWIDTRTGERPRVPDKRHDGKERLATNAEIMRYSDPTNKRLDPRLAKLLNPEFMKEYHYVSFQPKLLEMHASQFDAEQAMRSWQEDERFKGKLDLSQPMDVFRHDARQNEHYTSTQMQNLINSVRASDAYQRLDQNEQAAITRQMNLASEKHALRRGFKQRYLPRNYVKGATTQVLASLDDYSTTSSRYLAKVEYASQLKESSEKIKTYLKGREFEQGDRNYIAQRRVYDSFMRRIHSPTRNPHETVVSRALDRGMRITMLDKLPNVAYFTVNATEAGAIGIPMMAGRHSVTNAARTMGRMYRIAGTFVNFAKAAKRDLGQALRRGTDMTDYLNLYNEAIDAAGNRLPFAEGMKDLLKQARDRNLIDASASLEYQSSFETNRKTVDVMLDWGQGVFQAINTAIENLNRFVTLTTAYDLEMRRLLRAAEGGKEHTAGEAQYTAEQRHKAASEYAMTMLHQVNGVYANYNAPEYFTREGPLGMLGPVIFQFKKWPQRITMIYLRSALGLIKGMGELARDGRMTPQHKEAARQFIYMVAMVGLVAGAMGLPLEPFSHTVNLAYIMGLSNYNWDDVQAGFRTWVGKHGGADLAQLVAHGPLSFITGVDFAGRMSQSNMWAYGSPGSTKVRDLHASLMGLLGGATLGTASEIVTGLQKGAEAMSAYNSGADDVAAKKFTEFLKGILPLRLASDVLGSFTGSEGTELASGRKLGPDYTLAERLTRAGGFTPTRESEAREARNAIVSLDKREAAGRKALMDHFTRSPPGAQREAVWQRIQNDWNVRHPGYEITRDDLLKADRTLQKAKSESRDLLAIPQNKRIGSLMPMAEAYGYR